MKKGLVLFSIVLLIALFAAGISTREANAFVVSISTPQEECELLIQILTFDGSVLPGSHFNPEKEQCIVGFKTDDDLYHNTCYPSLDILQVNWGVPPYVNGATDAEVSSDFYFTFAGCYNPYGIFFKDPNQGGGPLGGGISFNYDWNTCTNGCNVTKFGLTGAAKRALGSLNGKVLGKTYIQIRDDDGNLVSGDFKLCFYAKGAANPYFFRLGGGNSWSPVGGYWNGNNFCMSGTLSGNYVMVDMP